jgi:hypothetical protein
MHNVAMPGADVSCLCVVEQAAAVDAEPQARYNFMTIKLCTQLVSACLLPITIMCLFIGLLELLRLHFLSAQPQSRMQQLKFARRGFMQSITTCKAFVRSGFLTFHSVYSFAIGHVTYCVNACLRQSSHTCELILP